MINSRCLFTLKTAYNCLQTISKKKTVDEIKPDDHTEFNKEIGYFALNSVLGTPQHKKAILSHILNYPLEAKTMYSTSKHASKITTNEPVGPSAHAITELPVIEALLDRYSADIVGVNVTSDTIPVVMEGQKQSNYDFLTTIRTKIDESFGYGQAQRTITKMQDCKDGSGIFKHATRGSMGIITFDKEERNIQTTPLPITENALKIFNIDRLTSLRLYLNQNKLLSNHFNNVLMLCDEKIKNLNTGKSIFDTNLEIENILWHEVQRHPLFPRSVSFVFIQKTTFEDIPNNFQQHVLKRLNPNRNSTHPYNLDKKGDAKEFYTIILQAYQKEVDPQIFHKLLHLKASGIKFNNFFNDILSSCIANPL